MGALLGCIIVLLAYTAFISYMHPADWVLYVLLGVFGVGFGALAYWLKDGIVIMATALLGSYGAVRAISGLIGGFPNEFEIY